MKIVDSTHWFKMDMSVFEKLEFLGAASSGILNICIEGNFITFISNLCQCLTTLTTNLNKNYYFFQLHNQIKRGTALAEVANKAGFNHIDLCN